MFLVGVTHFPTLASRCWTKQWSKSLPRAGSRRWSPSQIRKKAKAANQVCICGSREGQTQSLQRLKDWYPDIYVPYSHVMSWQTQKQGIRGPSRMTRFRFERARRLVALQIHRPVILHLMAAIKGYCDCLRQGFGESWTIPCFNLTFLIGMIEVYMILLPVSAICDLSHSITFDSFLCTELSR